MLLLGQAPDVSEYLFVGDTAYTLGREVPVCERDVRWTATSRDRKHALMVLAEDGRPTLHLWSFEKHTCKTVWQGTNEELSAVYWGNGRALVATGSVNVPNIVIQVNLDGSVKVVAENSWPNFTRDGARAVVKHNKQRLFQIVNEDGSLTRAIAIPDRMYLTYEEDLILAENDDDERLLLNLSTLEWQPTPPRVPAPRSGNPKPLPRLAESSLRLGVSGHEELVMYTVLRGEGIDRLVVAYGSVRPKLIGDNDGVLLQRGGSITFLPINKESASAVRARIAQAKKEEAIEGAKNMFLHFEAYARGHGGNMPDRNADLFSVFFDTSHDNPVLEEFSYEFAGGIPRDPGRTVLGYIRTATGRADLYADGHVVWVPGG